MLFLLLYSLRRALLAFLSNSKATNLSVGDASGSFNIFESDFKKENLKIFYYLLFGDQN
jgi:hypothetical protein